METECKHNMCACVPVCVRTGIDDLATRRDELQKEVVRDEEEKSRLQNDIRVLSERLSKLNETLARKIAARNEFDRTIAETEAAYTKASIPPIPELLPILFSHPILSLNLSGILRILYFIFYPSPF